ncbi:hypothetical protein K5I29_12460 [Flavobacterium agricola]|uniref:Alpha-ketoglutarate decarboxylase n=1 Tax=Flavobacterium agricola TaxID=2870839 RepID=A0ABY6M0J5_9FLAO|nr:hypothetical protein [Flavobacterium agricola]UYW01245.1 hypothetical protein K5I29_12460 [Flavobacterium agricola]
MAKKNIGKMKFLLTISLFLGLSFHIYAQEGIQNNQKSNFWERTRFGGNLGVGIGNNLTNIVVGPSAIYQFNPIVAAGVGLQYNYLHQKNVYKSNMYGVSLLGLVNPIEQVQLSVELEQLRVNNTNLWITPSEKQNFWNTGLFLGAGYSQNNVTVGIRYNILFNKNDMVYNQAWMPFVRVYF